MFRGSASSQESLVNLQRRLQLIFVRTLPSSGAVCARAPKINASNLRMLLRGLAIAGASWTLVLAFCLPNSLQAQSTAPPAVAIGSNPMSVYDVGEVDKVNPVNGNLYLNIPLVGFPQRGHQLRLNFRIFYNDKKWFIWNFCAPPANISNNYCENSNLWTWTGGPQAGGSWPNIMGVYVARDQNLDFGTDTATTSYMGNESYDAYYVTTKIHSYFVRESDGAQHYYGDWAENSCSTQGGGSCPSFPYIQPDQYPANDWSGYVPIPSSPNVGETNSVNGPDGVNYTLSTSSPYNGTTTDTAGNKITETTNGWIDSIGRNIPGSYTGPGTATGVDYATASVYSSEPIPGVSISVASSKCPSGTSQAREFAVPSVGGGTAPYYFCYSNFNYQTSFDLTTRLPPPTMGPNGWSLLREASGTSLLMSAIILPNGTSYTFNYDQYLSLTNLTLPTGASISYTWQIVPYQMGATPPLQPNPIFRALQTRTVNPGNGESARTWTYTWYNPNPNSSTYGGPTLYSIVTDPEGNDVERQLGGTDDAGNSVINSAAVSVASYFGCSPHDTAASHACSGSGVFLRKESYALSQFGGPYDPSDAPSSGVRYGGLVEPTVITTTIPTTSGNLVSQKVRTFTPAYGSCTVTDFADASTYSSNSQQYTTGYTTFSPCTSTNQVQSEADYDFGSGSPGSLLKTETTNYTWQLDTTGKYLAAGLIDLPGSVVTTDSTGAKAAETDFGYDESPSPSGTLGNPTSTTHWLTGGTSPVTKSIYNSHGMRVSVIDPVGYQSGLNYDSTGAFLNSVNYPSTNGISHIDTYVFDSSTGLITSHTDQNQKQTNYSYIDPSTGSADPLNRLHKITYPSTTDGTTGGTGSAYKQYTYVDTPGSLSVTEQDLQSTNGTTITRKSAFDGLGEVLHNVATLDSSHSYTTDTTYDLLGRVQSVTNPYSTTGDLTYGITSYQYDALGRKVDQCQSDNTPANSTTCVPTNSYLSWTYNGNAVTFRDESGNQWERVSDSLGRLTSVFEPNGSSQTPTMETDYAYDALDNLKWVAQWGTATGGSCGVIKNALVCNHPNGPPVTRFFTYDSLSRLLTAFNPETGTVCYGVWSNSVCGNGYDPKGNLTVKTDARGITTAYAYDVLNRLLSKTYNDGTLRACYQYDAAAVGGTAMNLKGRLTGEWTQAGACPIGNVTSIPAGTTAAEAFLQYDPMGRLLQEKYCTPQSCNYSNGIAANYDLAGDMTSVTYPDGRVVSQGFDAVGRLTAVNYASWGGTNVGSNYLTVNTYDAVGHPTATTLGDGITIASTYNSRLETTFLAYLNDATSLWSKSFTWAKNGNLQLATDNIAGIKRQFAYDSLNRLISAQDIQGSQGSYGQLTDALVQNQTNLLENSQAIDSNAAGWVAVGGALTPNSVPAPDGSMTAGKFVASSGSTDGYASDGAQYPALYDGLPVTGSVWLKVPSGAQNLNTDISIIDAGDQGWQVEGNTPVALTTTWQKFTVSATTQNGLSGLQLHMGGYGTVINGKEIDIWGPELGPTPTNTSVTNYVPYSQQIGGSFWGPYCAGNTSNITLNTAAFSAPDGSQTATGFVAPSAFSCGASGAWGAIATVAGGLTQGQTYTTSVWLRGKNGNEVVAFGLNDCAWGNVTLTNAWRRYTATFSAISSSIANCSTGSRGFQLADNSDANATFYAWGAQVEMGSTANQYVATLDSPVTVTGDSTNILPSSDQVGGYNWSVSGGAVVPNSTAMPAPDGSSTADTFTASSALVALVDQVPHADLYSGLQVTASVYLCVPSGNPNLNVAIYNTNSSGTTVVGTPVVANLTGTWQRFDITGTTANGLTALKLQISGTSLTVGQQIYIWGAQMVVGSSAGVPIQTPDTTTLDSNGSTVNLATNGLNESYSYDAFGNLQQAGNFSFIQAYTAANQLSGWNYDASGNLLIDGLNNGYAYDAEGRISGMGSYVVGSNGTYTFTPNYSYIYDADGSRVTKTGPGAADHIYFGGREIARLASGQWTDLIYGVSGLLAEVPGTQTGAPVYRMLDHLGTQVGTLDTNGVLLSLTDYAPFGQIFAGGSIDPYKFTGKERDIESGNDYFGARYYASSMGRFMSPDWAANPEAVPYANLGNPQSLNLYAYVGNNPLGRVDANGHCWGWIQWLCNAAQSVKNGVEGYGLHTNATVKTNIANERKWLLEGATDKGTINTVNGWDQRKVHDVYKCLQSPTCSQALAATVSVVTQWGWPGQKAYIDARNQLNQVNTSQGTIDNETLGGKVPTQEEAVKMIEESGGRVERIEPPHAEGGVSTHTESWHINYTSEAGVKGTISIQTPEE